MDKFSSNVIGSKFGRGKPVEDWVCDRCGTENPKYRTQCSTCFGLRKEHGTTK